MNDNEWKRHWFEYTGYVPHVGQEKIHFPDKPEARHGVFVCGRRFGKSLAASKEIEANLAKPKTRSWVVAPDHSLTDKVFREVWNTCINQGKLEISKKSNRKGDKLLETPWGSTVEAKSAENPDSLVGEQLDMLIIDEGARIKKKVWEELLLPTLFDRKGKLFLITTPKGYNWVYEKFMLGKTDPMWYSYQCPAWINTYVYEQGEKTPELLAAKREISPAQYRESFGAEFTSFAGRVFPFDRYKDVGDYSYNPDLPTFCSIDFGYRMPAVGWYQTNIIEGEWHIYQIDEINKVKDIRTVDLAMKILAKPYHVKAYYGDPAGSNITGSGKGDIEIFKNHGIKVRYVRDKISTNIPSGIEHVRSFMENANGLRRFHVDKKCIGSIEDYDSYAYPEDDKLDKLIPEKNGINDHGCDQLRYFFLNRFPIRKGKILTFTRGW